MYKEQLKNYLDDLASNKPAPGGGSAAALAAATGVSLISMVCNFTVGKEKYQAVQEEIQEILSSAENLRAKLLDRVDQDVSAYKKVSTAYGLPKESSEDRQQRTQAIQQALKQALVVPLEVCQQSHQAIKLCPVTAKKGNRNLISDVGVAVALLESAFYSAVFNVEINLAGIKDQQFILKVRMILEPLGKEIAVIKKQVLKLVQGK